jgi:thiamine-monophosphate kinase
VETLEAVVHYPETLAPEDIGFRALAVNLSDVAAMAGRPRWMTLALTLVHYDADWLDGFARGLFEAASGHGVSLIGGDTTRGTQTVISVQLLGDVARGGFLTRSGARSGDLLFVTGTPGDAAGGLAVAKRGADGGTDSSDERYLRQRFARPDARVEFGCAIGNLATAAIDVSDGLFADAGKLLAASGAGGRIELERLPLSAELTRAFGDDAALQFALAGGDDYELCFTAGAANESAVMAAASGMGHRVTRIGEVEDGRELRCYRDGEQARFSDDGYRHF